MKYVFSIFGVKAYTFVTRLKQIRQLVIRNRALRNQTMSGHSNLLGWTVTPYLNSSGFRVSVDMIEYTIRGEYNVTGWVTEDRVRGTGNCNITTLPADGPYGNPNVTLQFFDFTVNPEGYLDLKETEMTKGYRGYFGGKFENLEAVEEDIASMCLALYFYPQHLQKLQLAEFLQSFLIEVFEKTTYADIISGRGIP